MSDKTGIELIAQERAEQIYKHGRTVEDDVKFNGSGQLLSAINVLTTKDEDIDMYKHDTFIPQGWDKHIWYRMINKSYKERLIIAGALIAAEIDRLQNKTQP